MRPGPILFVFIAFLLSEARSLDCDETEAVQKCVDDLDFCLSWLEHGWPYDATTLCSGRCLCDFGSCVNSTLCFGGSSWGRYSALCREYARCEKCIDPASNLSPATKAGGAKVLLRVGGSVLVASLLLVFAGKVALSW